MHLIALHDSAGSGNPLGVSGNYDRLPMAPYFLFKVRRCVSISSLCKLQKHFPIVLQTPSLGSGLKSMPNIACLEKVQVTTKQLVVIPRSVKLDMIRAILPQVQIPVLSKEGDGPYCWNGSFYLYIVSALKGNDNGIKITRYAKSIIKVLSVQSKSKYSFYYGKTTVSTKGSNPYVGGGPVIAARKIFECCIPKGMTR